MGGGSKWRNVVQQFNLILHRGDEREGSGWRLPPQSSAMKRDFAMRGMRGIVAAHVFS
jgi:hypothetical protein